MTTPRRRRVSEDTAPSELIPTQSAGVDIEAENINIGGDVVGRDKVINNLVTSVNNFFAAGAEEWRERRNLLALLEKVKNFWVKGVLEKSLHGAALIELDKQLQVEAVQHPWSMVLRTVDQQSRTIPPRQKAVDLFEEMGRALLILGAPGSGKTVTALELARDTIVRAERDPAQPIPVLFNLSSWTDKGRSFADWLVDELNAKYQIPRQIGRRWIENNDLLLLLDGLDEVRPENRNACAEAINRFRQEHGLTDTVVCSRPEEYNALVSRLKLQGAILLQPLSREQIDRYLAAAGPKLAALRSALQTDAALQELAQSPLLLSVMSLAYQDVPVAALSGPDSVEARRRHVFATYVQQMFRRRTAAAQRYPAAQTMHWLTWLAQQLSRQAQTVFLIEGLQPSWLPTRQYRRLFTVMTTLVGLALALVIQWAGDRLSLWALGGPGDSLGPIGDLVVGLILIFSVVLIAILIIGPSASKPITTVEAFRWSWRRALTRFILGLIVGLCIGLALGTAVSIFLVFSTYTSADIIAFADIADLTTDPTELAIMVLVVRIVLAAFLSVVFGFILALIGGVYGGIMGGLSGKQVEFRMVPNHGVRQSAKNAVIVGVGMWLATILTAAFGGIGVGLLLGDPSLGLEAVPLGIGFGAYLGLFAGLIKGGRAVVKHYILRFLLYRSGCAPWKYARFLDYAAELIFLRKVGGGYIFVHRLLQEYFASLEPEQSTPLAERLYK